MCTFSHYISLLNTFDANGLRLSSVSARVEDSLDETELIVL